MFGINSEVLEKRISKIEEALNYSRNYRTHEYEFQELKKFNDLKDENYKLRRQIDDLEEAINSHVDREVLVKEYNALSKFKASTAATKNYIEIRYETEEGLTITRHGIQEFRTLLNKLIADLHRSKCKRGKTK